MFNDDEPRYRLFHLWLILTAAITFAAYLGIDSGLYGTVVRSDPSRLSLAISVLFCIGIAHCGLLSLRLAREQDALRQVGIGGHSRDPAGAVARLRTAGAQHSSAAVGFLAAVAARLDTSDVNDNNEYAQLTDVLAEQLRGQHEAGWFVTNMLVKLGLLGTVIGFILMLRSVMSIESFDISEAQGLLGAMTVGMGVALNTTMLGLVCSILLGMQYLLVDRGADRLLAEAVYVTESSLIPALRKRNDGV